MKSVKVTRNGTADTPRYRCSAMSAVRIHNTSLNYSKIVDTYVDDGVDTSASSYERPVTAAARAVRYRRLLYSIALRVLSRAAEVEQAVDNCLARASQNPPTLNDEGAFRSWLIRQLINEALLIFQQEKHGSTRSLYHRGSTKL